MNLETHAGMSLSATRTETLKGFVTEIFTRLGVPAEAAGLSPKHGCRIGICASCQCLKRSGTVQNLQTGALCSAPDQTIRLCISAARSELALDL